MKPHPSPQRSEADTPLVTLLHAREAYDFEFVTPRLHDRHLLDSSVAVRVFRAPLLAVPVGGRRRGGCMDIGPVEVALAVRHALSEIPGFPNVRIRLVSPPYEPNNWVVEWGERPPFRITGSDRVRFYGGADHCIAEADAVAERRAVPKHHSPAATPCGL
ncbi:hypothetical protein EES39_40410 [Streptomyces sp. ADI92-24]|uniref:DUF6302 family protein n=1 Tax=Streptomyces sp. ADI92-24 TaxID=1522756 RepID=UPI000F552DDD|nr:DUF6302 family protein [Streptomyces sp. ADI92-24]RPK29210.1 hypothetical protein EES39_40410 [Streptomyces sp. ADI92-24]